MAEAAPFSAALVGELLGIQSDEVCVIAILAAV